MMRPLHIGASGLLGWNILKRTEARHMEMISKDSQVQRSLSYFGENIQKKSTAAELVSDYRLLNVALGAFGLDSDIGNKAFIRKVLESDLSDSKSLANRLSDKRYFRLAEAFGYGSPDGVHSTSEDFVKNITTSYLQREFESRVGEGDERLRLALNARRELANMASRESSDKTLWFEVLGNAPLRKVFEGALGFGPNYAKMPIDRQHAEFSSSAKSKLGIESFSDFSSEKNIERVIRFFLLRTEVEKAPVVSRFNIALSLLEAGSFNFNRLS